MRNILTNDNILKVVLKHHIYEMCINVCFSQLKNNFKSDKKRIPEPGEKFACIHDKVNDDIYFNCAVIRITDCEIYKDFTDSEKRELAFAISFDRSEYDGQTINENDIEYFTYGDMENLVFT